jgi:hypothetical protein
MATIVAPRRLLSISDPPVVWAPLSFLVTIFRIARSGSPQRKSPSIREGLKVSPDNRLPTCQNCHAGATAGFATFQPHATTNNYERYPHTGLASKFILGLWGARLRSLLDAFIALAVSRRPGPQAA